MNSADLAWVKAPADTHGADRVQTRTVALFSVTLFTSAFLLFSVQPMVAKQVLPIFGGTPMVWNACVVFFQTTLFAGYVYAAVAARWRLRTQIVVHLAMVAAVLFALPFIIDRSAAASASDHPVRTLLTIVTRAVAIPFFVLSTSASILQHWFAHTRQARAHDPYFLYVSSNVGSFAALLAYPAVIEPALSLAGQNRYWTIAYMAFVGLMTLCGVLTLRTSDTTPEPRREAENQATAALTTTRRLRWVALSFIPSSLMLAVTTYLSTDIAAVPLFWIVPLAIYLLTFVVAFGSAHARAESLLRRVAPMLAIPVVMFMSAGTTSNLFVTFGLHLALFGVVAQLCHFRIAADRPDSSRLTEFYLCLSLGGMLGGLFNTLAAPMLFTTVREYPLVLVAAFAAILVRDADRPGSTHAADVLLPLATGLLAWTAAVAQRTLSMPLAMVLLGIAAIVAFSQRRRPIRFALCLAGMLFAGMFGLDNRTQLHAERTFFGIYRVVVDPASQFHVLSHGTTLHGIQSYADGHRRDPLSYYHRTGPMGDIFDGPNAMPQPRAVGVVGLGVGSLAAYAQVNDRWVFYEIDPAVERMARNREFFSYLDDCGGTCRVVLGDARLSLASAASERFDVIVVDAFTSDAIPVHLLTTEAVGVYANRLTAHGRIAFHISNKHLALTKVVAAVAGANGLSAAERFDTQGDVRTGKNSSRWIVAARNTSDLEPLTSSGKWTRLTADPASAWTDDFSNILTALTLR